MIRQMISYWKNYKEIYRSGEFVVIFGEYNHLNSKNGSELCIGMYWDHGELPSFPNSRGKISPMVIERTLIEGILNTLAKQRKQHNQSIKSIEDAAKGFDIVIS